MHTLQAPKQAHLYVEQYGQGEPLLLLHGWGMHGGLWHELLPHLAAHYTVYVVDLWGHGHSPAMPHPYALAQMVAQLQQQFPEPLHVLGWSLGGLIALQWALQAPQQIKSLSLIGSSPCFMQQADWPCAMAADVLQQFADSLQQDYRATLARFIVLQTLGAAQPHQLKKQLQLELARRPEPQESALQQALAWLQCADIRAQVGAWHKPTLLLYGDKDALVPLGAGQWLAHTLPQAQLHVFAQCGHAPHWSHPAECAAAILTFLETTHD